MQIRELRLPPNISAACPAPADRHLSRRMCRYALTAAFALLFASSLGARSAWMLLEVVTREQVVRQHLRSQRRNVSCPFAIISSLNFPRFNVPRSERGERRASRRVGGRKKVTVSPKQRLHSLVASLLRDLPRRDCPALAPKSLQLLTSVTAEVSLTSISPFSRKFPEGQSSQDLAGNVMEIVRNELRKI